MLRSLQMHKALVKSRMKHFVKTLTEICQIKSKLRYPDLLQCTTCGTKTSPCLVLASILCLAAALKIA